MTIRSKLTLNVVITLATVAVVAGTSIVGVRYLKARLGDLTQRSVPFQVRTLDLQRAVQRSLGDLVRIAAAQGVDEYRTYRTVAEKTLGEVRVAQQALDSLGGAGGDTARLLSDVSRELFAATEQRLSSEAEAASTTKTAAEKISSTLTNLGALEDAARKIQQARQRDYLTAYAAARGQSAAIQGRQQLSGAVKDLQLAFLGMHGAKDKIEFLKARGRTGIALKKIQQADSEVLRTFPVALGVLAEKVEHYGKVWVPPGADAADRAPAVAAFTEIFQLLAETSSRVDKDAVVVFEKSRVEIERLERLMKEVEHASDAVLASSRSAAVFRAIDGVSSKLPLCETKVELDAAGGRLQRLFKEERSAAGTLEQAVGRLGKGVGLGSVGAVNREAKEIAGLMNGPGGVVEKVGLRLAMNANALAATEKLRRIVSAQRADGDRAVNDASAQQEQALAAVHRVVRDGTILIAGAASASVLLGIGFGLWVYRSISRPLKNLIEVSERVAGGDLQCELSVHARDEVGRVHASMARMVTNLRGIVTRIGDATASLAGSSEELSATALDLERGSTEQTSQIQQSAAAVHQIAQTTVEVARSSSSASQTAGEMRQRAEQGRDAMQLTVGELKKFAEQVEEAVSTVEKLGKQSEQIGGIVQVIDGIADQTNLLALNAAIEAARAGEQGRGFAVVADEVRKLAERTGTATGEIGQVVKTMQHSVGQAVRFIKDERESAERILERVNRTLDAIEEIARHVASVTGAVQQTAAAVEEQSVTTDEVSRNMENAAAVTVQLQHSVGGIRGSSEELSRLASDLNSLVEWFKV